MRDILTQEAYELAEGGPPVSDMAMATRIAVRTSFLLREQFRFPRTKKRRIRRKWAKRKRNWRPITDRAFRTPDGSIVCSPEFARAMRLALQTRGDKESSPPDRCPCCLKPAVFRVIFGEERSKCCGYLRHG